MSDEKLRKNAAKPTLWTWLLAWSVLAFGAGVVSSGCSVSADVICSVKCNCEGCSQAQRDDCVSDVNATVQKAADLGCSTQYQDWLNCVDEEAECRNGETFAWDGCEIEEDALAECGGGNPCTAAAKKLCNECGSACTDPDPTVCTGRTACLSQCVVDATCDEINSGSGKYSSCTAACP